MFVEENGEELFLGSINSVGGSDKEWNISLLLNNMFTIKSIIDFGSQANL